MEYAAGRPGRIFYVRFDTGEDLLPALESFIRTQEIASGIIHLIGAVSAGSLVTGPRETVIPPDPVWTHLTGAYELVGTGMIRTGLHGPRVHLHASAGRGETVLTGCFRKDMTVYLVIEAVIMEFSGITVTEVEDTQSGITLPSPSSGDKNRDRS